MTHVVLTLKETPTARIDASSLSIDTFASLGKPFGESEIASLPLGNELCIGDLFRVQSSSGNELRMTVQGDLTRFDHMGAHHNGGTIVVEGNVGHSLASGMTGGHVLVRGDAGDSVGGPVGGMRKGMTGGRVEILGSVGDRTGYRMRRGEVFVSGDAGDFLATHMLAGTIIVAGNLGSHVGYGMRRGSVIAFLTPELPSPRFSDPVPVELTWLRLMASPSDVKLNELLTHQSRNSENAAVSRRGDGAVGGLGEVISAFG